MAIKFPKFDPVKFLFFIVLSLVFTGMISFILSTFFSGIPIIQVGIPFILITVALAVILPFALVINDGKLGKKDTLAILFYAVIVLVVVLFLPKLLPQFFSGVPDLLDSINIFNSVILP